MVTKQPTQKPDAGFNKADHEKIASAQDSGSKTKQDSFRIQTPQLSIPKHGGARNGNEENFPFNAFCIRQLAFLNLTFYQSIIISFFFLS